MATAGNPIVVSAPTLSGSTLTFTFKVATGVTTLVEDFQIEFKFDPAKATFSTASLPSGWLSTSELTGAGVLAVAGITTSGGVVGDGLLATISFTLAAGETSLSGTYSGFTGALDVVNTGVVLSNGSVIANAPLAGLPTITGTPTEDQVLTAVTSGLSDGDGLGAFSYQWLRDGSAIGGATAATYTLGDLDAGKKISVKVSYTDGAGNAESATSAATATVANVNDAPTGSVTIGGTASQGQTLTASNTLADADGLGTISYQWLANGAAISGATAGSYALTQADVGKTISVKASYTDGFGKAESVTSAATAAVANVNDAPTGSVTLSGTATQGQTLTAANTLADIDGLGTISYQWQAGGTDIAGATGSTYTLTQADVGKAITVKASYTDGFGKAESVTSTATAAVANINDAPTGAVTITGTATQGQTLTATNTLADADGLGTISYQWLANNAVISGATAGTYTLTQAEVGKTITVKASYTDGFSTAESVTSAATAAVANVNDVPTGSVTLSGTATQGQTLTAANTLADADGLGTISYQWLANGAAISGATAGTYTLTQAEVGKTISVKASYTDGFGKAESVTSAASASVANINDAPTGTITITGATTKGQTLTAVSTLADADGLGTLSYQWFAGGTAISGATASTYTLTSAEVGKTITVKASYTDGFGAAESATSAASSTVVLDNLPTGNVTIAGTPTQGQTLTASNTLADADGPATLTVSYQWQAGGVDIAGATASSYTLTQAEVGKAVTVKASYTDALGTLSGKTSAATTAVANVNDPLTGAVTITGTVSQGSVLTANTSALVDPDGIGTLSYQWSAGGTAIAGATGATFTPTQAEVGKTITVKVSYTDTYGTAESTTSAATVAVANVNDAPTGSVTITGTATQGQTLTAANTLADADGLGTISYQWQAGGVDIAGATTSTFVLGQAQVGKTITVKASYTDGFAKAESVSSAATAAVANVNDAPTGSVTITGTATQGQTLTAANTLADIDGLGTISYQWFAGVNAIKGATASTYTLTQAEVGQAITVKASYTDGQGTPETVGSAATSAVANVNDAPTGAVTITGTATQGQTLTAANTLADADGLGTITYQWFAGGTAIAGATGSTYVLKQAEVGKTVTVKASYTDALGTAESVTSAATTAVANVNDAPTGSVTIAGTATQGQTLTASNTLADADGLGTISYQWLANGTAISGATAATYTLTQAEVGKTITVKASYTDGFSTAESVTSAATAAVANVNDAPTGAVTVTGTATQGQTLTAANTLADLDGLGTIGYQWQAGGVDIAGATASTYTLTQAEVGKTVTVKASYTDGFGKAESVTSAATTAVANVNDKPTGGVTITGTATQGQTLTAANTLADIDGLGTISYQWQAGGVDIAGATGSTLVLGQAQVGKTITVKASYTDGQGTAESVPSAATAAVANVNDAPTGTIAISGSPTKGQTLTAVSTLADADGLGTLSYQWFAGGTAIAGATASTYVLTATEVGKTITVKASYTDGFGAVESATSAATATVILDNLPTGNVTISGTATQGQTLTAANTLADADGPATLTVSYQWQAGGVDIAGATGSSYVLKQAEVGKAITVKASYTDALGTLSGKTSAATAAVANVNDPMTGAVTITGTVSQGSVLTANTSALADPDGLGTLSYQWFAGGTAIAGATGSTFKPTQAEVGKTLTVKVSTTDLLGSAESATSAATAAVANVNDAPTGSVTITGTATQGQTLTAANTLADADGLGTLNYQWFAGGTAITGATGSTYVLKQAEVGKTITVKASYTDGFGFAESLTSAATTAVANVNDAPTGSVTITGTATQGQTLTAANTLADIDGLGTISYQWFAGVNAIKGATASTYTLTQAEVGQAVTVKASYTDGQGTPETVGSAATTAVANVNDAPTGAVTIAGTATQGQTLTAANTLADIDGLGTISYQWFAGGTAIAGATGSTYVLKQAEVGKTVTVKASYTDALGTAESVTSAATTAVANVNDAPTGSVTIAGTVTQGQTLTAANTLADADGLGTIGYQWLANGTAISGATAGTYTLTQAEVGKTITVKASYNDLLGAAESMTSAATAAVANVNDAPTGSVTVSGTATQGQTLTAANTLADLDGLGKISYQWLADGAVIAGATAQTYALTQAEVGKAVSVKASYIDGGGAAESRTSTATARVANVNDAPTGAVTIAGTAAQGQTLMVTNTLADLDGITTIGYQWFVGGNAVSGATGTSYTLTQAEVGKTVTVKASYTDGFGFAESVSSTATTAVANVNDAPAGSVAITGAKIAGMPLSVDISKLSDLDGIPAAGASGAPSFTWLVNNVAAVAGDGAVSSGGSVFTPTAATVGKAITLKVSYTDLFGTAESITSTAVTLANEDSVTAPTATGIAGDGNGDGVKDSTQAGVASAPFTKPGTTTTSFVTLVTGATSTGGTDGSGTITDLKQVTPPASKPAKLLAPLDVIDFTATAPTKGATTSFSLFVDRTLGVNGYWKQDAKGFWVNLASAAYGGATTVVGTKIKLDFKITDGGIFDKDGSANGVIVDPGLIGTLPLSLVGYAPDVTLTSTSHFFF